MLTVSSVGAGAGWHPGGVPDSRRPDRPGRNGRSAGSRRPPYVAYLRVFEPVEHLPEQARARWVAYAASQPGRAALEAAEFAAAVRRLAGRPPVPVPPVESRDGLLLEVDGATYVCPQQTRLRVWRQLTSSDPGETSLSSALGETSPALREQAAADLADYTRDGGEPRVFTRATTWRVPVSWFVPFAGDERDLVLDSGRDSGPAGAGAAATGERHLRYRTTMSSARRRCAHGLRAARAHLDDDDVIAEIEAVARWLEQFDHRSMLELDYAGLVELLDDAHLLGDDSADDVAQGLAALVEGDALSAAAAYRRFSTRWQRVALLARAS